MNEPDSLERYRAKRRAGATPEPGVDGSERASGAEDGSSGGVFVIHQHDASRLHWDLRLEMGGTLVSWAVPKGPSLDPAEKRLAVHVEDHPLEYVDFEDVIPEGNYGAGPMIIWDRGDWVALEDPVAGLEAGKLLFELRGYKLRGVWTLVKIKRAENEWLLIRETRHMSRAERAAASEADARLPAVSILSGLTVEELGARRDRSAEFTDRLEAIGAADRPVRAERVEVMLARAVDAPFSHPDWLFEPKLDGYRMLASRAGPAARLLTRNGNDATRTFPELARALKALPVSDFVLDGEVVQHDPAGRPSFQRLQQRARLRRQIDVKWASLRRPTTFYVFDLLGLCGHDLRSRPIEQRKEILADLLPPAGPLRYVDHFIEQGEALYEHVIVLGLEGIVGKRRGSTYRKGRSDAWRKVRAEQSADLVIVGFTEPGGARPGFGALHVAGYEGEELRYAGRVGTGFSDAQLVELHDRLVALARDESVAEGSPADTGSVWVEPDLVAEVRFLELTDDRLLRHPVFSRLRDDKPARECAFPDPGSAPKAPADDAEADDRSFEADAGTVNGAIPLTPALPPLSNPEKIFWPEDGYTKRDLYEYYRAVAPWLLPYLADRPLVLTRYPDGIDGKSFYQKNAPVSTPEWIRTVNVASESSDKEIDYFVCDDEASLLYLANLGSIPLHVWASRVGSLDRPDWCILDLDPKGAPFSDVVRIANRLHRLCEEIELASFVKTSGSSGLHVLLPLGQAISYEQSRTLGELLARLVVEELPEIATVTRSVEEREGKVYVDFLQNRRGQLLAAPFSVRPVPGALVSAPLRWREVNGKLRLDRFTIRTMPARLARMKDDPLLGVLDDTPDLPAALGRLAARMADG
ncbi:MAG TPA: DNA ligase D [Gemmatimonadota bacterium]|nr:DNA ligase D [Gemmatimonadota bacterium]